MTINIKLLTDKLSIPSPELEEREEQLARALWYATEAKRYDVAVEDESPRIWEKYPKGAENYDVNRFSFDRNDFRQIAARTIYIMENEGK